MIQQDVEAKPFPDGKNRASGVEELTPRAAAIVEYLIDAIPRFKPGLSEPTAKTLIRDLAIDSLVVMEILFSVEERFGFDLPLTTDLFHPDDDLTGLARRVDFAASEFSAEF